MVTIVTSTRWQHQTAHQDYFLVGIWSFYALSSQLVDFRVCNGQDSSIHIFRWGLVISCTELTLGLFSCLQWTRFFYPPQGKPPDQSQGTWAAFLLFTLWVKFYLSLEQALPLPSNFLSRIWVETIEGSARMTVSVSVSWIGGEYSLLRLARWLSSKYMIFHVRKDLAILNWWKTINYQVGMLFVCF